ncbi:Putative Zn-dependent protease, contains TPR repeats [Consotaella salsifontis]|uniref:Putative Zn-dependent protease, contains TPR repeats n=2 Tax=Consotaella salsifontis TaxID=1365950 RepID=A0A1T4LR85_9HYPH|nr:Putative Zn-dependent protease, contains TPR repeats [Consotaella salsifontis]
MRFTSYLLALVFAFAPNAAMAIQARGNVPVVRDAEIEGLVEDYVRPLLGAAGLSRSGIEVILVNDPGFNAFVSGRRIFINTGTIAGSERPSETIGVLAHEIGHLAGGHQQRLREQLERASTIAMVATALGVGAIATGAATGQREVARAGSGIAAGTGDFARRLVARYQRGEETTADRAALTYLEKTKQSPKGLLDGFEGLMRSNMFSTSRGDAYLSSHPMPQDRLAFLQTAAKASPYYDKPEDPTLQERHDLARAKIAAYTGGAVAVQRLFAKQPFGLATRYGIAIATHLNGSPSDALTKFDALIQTQPKNPWFHEMRGEVLMRAGRAREAADAYRKAASLDKSKSGVLQAEIGQALVTGGDPKSMKEAVRLIKAGLQSDPDNPTAYRFLAMAYGRLGDVGAADLATAEGHWHVGAYRDAKVFAARAQQNLKPGTPLWRQAEDIINTKISPKT